MTVSVRKPGRMVARQGAPASVPASSAASVGASRDEARGAARSRRRLWLLRGLTASLPVALLLLVELALRLVPAWSEVRDPYVNVSPLAAFSRQTIDGRDCFTITHDRVYSHGSVTIPVVKPADTLRIFCVGSSACAGWPHPQGETFTAYLKQALATAHPGMNVEVVNAAAHGFAAYRTRRILDEVVEMQPDAILVWEGNNEFLEDRSYDSAGAWVDSIASHLRVTQALVGLAHRRMQLSGEQVRGEAQTLWKKMHQQALRLREDPGQFAKVKEHFKISFEHMVEAAQRHHVPLVLCTVPVNLRDWLPTVSRNRLEGAARRQWQLHFDEARRGLEQGDCAHGLDQMRQALAMEEEHAESWFWLGRLLEADGQKAAARDAYEKARDLDLNPFRAIGAFNETIRELAQENRGRGVVLLDLERLFSAATPNAAPGFDLFLDYVHPTKPANLRVAAWVYDLLANEGVAPKKAATDRFEYHDLPTWPDHLPYRDETDRQLQNAMLALAQMNRQYERSLDLTEALFEQANGQRPSGTGDPMLAHAAPLIRESYVVFKNYLDVERRRIAGEPVTAEQQDAAARALTGFYDKYYAYDRN